MLGALIEGRNIVNFVAKLSFHSGILIALQHIILSGVIRFFNQLYGISCYKINAILYLFNGANIIDNAYLQANGKPFEVQTPGRKHHMVTSSKHLNEINYAPLDVLSLHAVAKDFLQPKHTMHGFEWQDVRGREGTGFVRALRTVLAGQLPDLIPCLKEVIEDHLEGELKSFETSTGTSNLVVYDVAKTLVAKANCTVFFGSHLAQDHEFFEAACQFPHDSAFAAEIIRCLPHPIGTFLARRATRNYRCASRLHELLTHEIAQRLAQSSKDGADISNEQNDGLQWLIDTSPKKNPWSVDRIVGEVMGIWYGSVHTLSIAMTFAIFDLYTRQEYVEPLRAELEEINLGNFKGQPAELPLLDSFLRESARLSAFESTGIRRQALQQFTFSDGLKVHKGDWVCVPHRSMMRDDAYFSNALHFNGFRFVQRSEQKENFSANASDGRSQLVGAEYVWGYGRIVCPGRFYATVLLKLVLSTMLMKYDCKMPNIRGTGSFQWRSSIIPKRSITITVRRRDGE
ncbi:MAG: hypothetical protein M1820_004426 [Bogoriella megaspora]|nr:MAG: hypothetical protein M1820_004426 [Bogoriella megaspora]